MSRFDVLCVVKVILISLKFFFSPLFCVVVLWLTLMNNDLMQDVVDPILDEMLAKFVVDSHFKSKAKGSNLDDKSNNNSQEDMESSGMMVDPEVLYNTIIPNG